MEASDYPRKQTLDVRASMAKAIATKIAGLTFVKPGGGEMRLLQVFDHWPEYEQKYLAPSACVLPSDVPLTGLTTGAPVLIEDTWYPAGQPGFALYETGEVTGEFRVLIRAPSDAERSALLTGLETTWISEDEQTDTLSGSRGGVILTMPEYYGLTGSFTLDAIRVIDSGDAAMRNHREAEVTVTGMTSLVALARLAPMRPSIRLAVKGTRLSVRTT